MKKESKVNEESLKKAFSCYFSIERNKRPRLNDYLTKKYLFEIARRRRFLLRYKNAQDIKVFAYWLGNGDITAPTTQETAKYYNTTAPKVQVINARFINLLIDEILKDLETDLIKIKPYLESKTEIRKRQTQSLHFFGLKQPTPLRLPTEIKRIFNEIDLKTPPPPKKTKGTNQAARLYLWLDDCKRAAENDYFLRKNKDLTQKAQKEKELIEIIENHKFKTLIGDE